MADIDPAYGFQRLSTDRYPTERIITTLRSIPLENLILTFAEDPSVYHYVLELAARYEELARPADPDVVAEEPADVEEPTEARWNEQQAIKGACPFHDGDRCQRSRGCLCFPSPAGPSPEEENHA